MQKINVKEMSHDEWLNQRRIGIGGSDVSAIMGLNSYKSPMSVYLDKIGETPLEDTTSEAAYWGTQLEDVIAKHYAEVNNVKVRRNNHILISEEYPFMIANLDREVYADSGERYGLEVKTAGLRSSQLWDDESVPVPYVLQIQHYLAVTGWDKFVCAALIGGQKYVEREVPRDEDIIARIRDVEAEFWNLVETRTPPAWDGSEQATKILKALYPKAEPGKTIELPSDLSEVVARYSMLKEQSKVIEADIKTLKEQQKACEQQIASVMQDAEIGYIDGMQVSYKTTERKEYVVAATSYRTMRIKELKEGAM